MRSRSLALLMTAALCGGGVAAPGQFAEAQPLEPSIDIRVGGVDIDPEKVRERVDELSSKIESSSSEREESSKPEGERSSEIPESEFTPGEIAGIVIGSLLGLALLLAPAALGMINITLPI